MMSKAADFIKQQGKQNATNQNSDGVNASSKKIPDDDQKTGKSKAGNTTGPTPRRPKKKQ
mgnify:CR=1 FL=1